MTDNTIYIYKESSDNESNTSEINTLENIIYPIIPEESNVNHSLTKTKLIKNHSPKKKNLKKKYETKYPLPLNYIVKKGRARAKELSNMTPEELEQEKKIYRIIRLEKSRIAAKKCRERKKREMEQLKKECELLNEKNKKLKIENEKLKLKIINLHKIIN